MRRQGLEPRTRGYQRLGAVIALPALPMLGGAVLVTWLAGAEQLLWPEMIARTCRTAQPA